MVIIGILAAIAIPKFANTKEKAYIASMKSDLRNLVTAEEAYFADSIKYTDGDFVRQSGARWFGLVLYDHRQHAGRRHDRHGYAGRLDDQRHQHQHVEELRHLHRRRDADGPGCLAASRLERFAPVCK